MHCAPVRAPVSAISMTLQAVSRYKCQYRKVLGFKPFLLFYILNYVIARYIIRRKGVDWLLWTEGRSYLFSYCWCTTAVSVCPPEEISAGCWTNQKWRRTISSAKEANCKGGFFKEAYRVFASGRWNYGFETADMAHDQKVWFFLLPADISSGGHTETAPVHQLYENR